MRRRVFIPLVLSLAATLFAGCKANDTAGSAGAALQKTADGAGGAAPPASGTTEVHADGVRRVTVEELQRMLADGRAVIYDTRARTAYDAEHIKGAASMPFDEVERRAGELPRDKTLIFYCTWPNEHTSAGAALTLKKQNVEDTAALLGGMYAWKNAGLPTEGAAANNK